MHSPAMTTARRIDEDRGARIKFVRVQILGLKSQEKLAELLSREGTPVTRGAVGNWELGKEVGIESLSAICRAAGVDLNWLAYGSGDEPPGASSNKTARLISSYDPDDADTNDDTGHSYTREHWVSKIDGAIPEIDVKLGAGTGSIGEVINLPVGRGNVSGHAVVAEWLIPAPYLRHEANAAPNQTIVMEVVGDSMQPTYMPGDRVLVDLSQDRFVSDTVYAISDGVSEPQIKRLQRIPFSDPVEVRIISDNPNLETFTADLSRVRIIGRICGHIARK